MDEFAAAVAVTTVFGRKQLVVSNLTLVGPPAFALWLSVRVMVV
jgi:hypothetical protein